MATKRPSFLKRQKEQKRNARAIEKREARRVRREAKTTGNTPLPETGQTVAETVENTEPSPG